MNLTINELERRLYIEDRQPERAALLTFEEAWDNAEENRCWNDADGDLLPEQVAEALVNSWRPAL